ncbi:glycosyltransferase family 39 protein [Aquisphaera giovannonii]|uniref:glycosyltransferase family 39 protein n=1 Tax=Aquisphaera giovannonii TaxID=406548 RepID=UPI00143D0643|nr:glycosyltransferase family 39 protein [Aquisphaera giovannonii]
MRGTPRPRLLLASLVLSTALIRMAFAGQPIVENYVGRQIPTAMVARNLDRGSGFLRPSLDTAPLPNYFVVEPPVYEAIVVGFRRLTGMALEASGRCVSALAAAMAAWGLCGLVRRRDGDAAAAAALVAFCAFPVTLRYGRAFQPDALMLGGVLAGLECADRASRGARGWWAPAFALLATGLAAKVTGAFAIVPLLLVIAGHRRRAVLLLAAAAIVPAACWYAWVPRLIASSGSRASAENRAIWMAVVGLSALARPETIRQVGRFLLVRAFGPPGVLLGALGVAARSVGGVDGARRPEPRDLWKAWAASALAMLALLGAKLHHEYYWLSLAPALAAGIGRLWARHAGSRRAAAWLAAAAFLAGCGYFSRTTWRTPDEWAGLEEAAAEVRRAVPGGDWLVAAEPLLYQADRRGCRLERTPSAAARAAAEWPGAPTRDALDPADLVEFYRARGARYVADLASGPADPARDALHRTIRARYKVVKDTPSVLIAELESRGRGGAGGHGQ